MPAFLHPPRPRLVYRVGITGHRLARLAPDQIERINRSLTEILLEVSATVARAHADFTDFYTTEPPVTRLISPLADGADSLAAGVALAQGYELCAPIPFTKDDYATDFAGSEAQNLQRFLQQAESIYELDGERTSPRGESAAYLAAGYLTLKQSDIMVAIWDGEGARGLGGTGMIVEAAVQQGIPTIWINSESAEAPCLLSEDLTCDRPLSDLTNIITRELAPPFLPGDDDSGSDNEDCETEKSAAQAFFGEGQHRNNYGIFFRLLEATLSLKWPRGLSIKRENYFPRTAREWKPFADGVSEADAESNARLDDVLLPRYCWADNLALHYADIYRSSYSLNYLLSAFAVFLALLGLIVGGKQFWISLEVIVILHVLFLTLRGKKNRWHERWIDYRQLAEQLRHLRYLYLSGGLSRESRVSQSNDGGVQDRSWVQWYYQASVRELGMATATCSDQFRKQLTQSFVYEELDPQISYHQSKSVSLHRMEHALHKVGEWVFGSTLAICVGFLILYIASKFDSSHSIEHFIHSINYPVTMATAFLPSLGAAMFGIRVQGEFASTGQRSQAMNRRLLVTRNELAPYIESTPPNMRDLRRNIETAAETMMIEIVDWKFVYSSKPLSLPA